MSRNNLHNQSNQPPTPAHNHQSTNHEHLQSLTTTIHKLTHLSHSPAGLKFAWLTTLVDVRLSVRPSWNSSPPVETQVYLQWYCTSCFQCTLHYLSYVGSPAWVTLNKLPFDSHEYTLRFHTLAAASGWNEVALLSTYRRGLNPALHQQMSIYDDSIGFESFLQKAARVSQRLTASHMDSIPIATASPSRPLPVPEPMITDSYHLSVPERSHRLTQGLCLYCGSAGHQLRTCPIRPTRLAVSTIQKGKDTYPPTYA